MFYCYPDGSFIIRLFGADTTPSVILSRYDDELLITTCNLEIHYVPEVPEFGRWPNVTRGEVSNIEINVVNSI